MAVSVDGVGTVSETTTSATTIAVPYPSGLTSNSIMVLFVSMSTLTLSTLPSGWTQVYRASNTGGTLFPSLLVAIKQATGSETGSLTVTTPLSKGIGQIVAFGGVDTSNPQDTTATNVDQTASANTTALPTLSTTLAGSALVYSAAFSSATVSASPPTTPSVFTETADRSPTGTRGATLGYLLWSGSGPTSTVSVGWDQFGKSIGTLLALRPAISTVTAAVAMTATSSMTVAGTVVLAGASECKMQATSTMTATAVVTDLGFVAMSATSTMTVDATRSLAAAVDMTASSSMVIVTFPVAPIPRKVQLRRNTVAAAQASNPFMDFGEFGYDGTNLRGGPIGGGRWNDIPSFVRTDQLSQGGGGTSSRGLYLTVGSSALNPTARAACDYQCDGIDDQVQINQALQRASRPGDGFGGEGYIGVALVGPTFLTSQNGADAIYMYPSTRLIGAGPGTLISPKWPTAVDRGCIELLNANCAHVEVANLSIGNASSAQFNGHGIKFTQQGVADAYEIKSGNDAYNTLKGVTVFYAGGKGAYLTGTSGGNRESRVIDCSFFHTGEDGLLIAGSSDNEVINTRANGSGVGFACFNLGGGNLKIADSKCYFAGQDGFVITSGRIEVSNCAAQDNGRNGFVFAGADATAAECVADSNQRTDQSGAGFVISARGVYNGLHSYDRNATPGSRQTSPFVISGSPKIFLTGRSSLAGATGGTHITGSPAADSYVRIIRDDSTLYSFG